MLQKILRGPGIEPGSTAWKAAMLTITPATLVKSLQKQKTPEVRLELTTYRLTAGRYRLRHPGVDSTQMRSWSSGYDRRLPSDGPGFNSRRAQFFCAQTVVLTKK